MTGPVTLNLERLRISETHSQEIEEIFPRSMLEGSLRDRLKNVPGIPAEVREWIAEQSEHDRPYMSEEFQTRYEGLDVVGDVRIRVTLDRSITFPSTAAAVEFQLRWSDQVRWRKTPKDGAA